MRTPRELDLLDRATLRIWRIANLLGWGVAGMLVAAVTGIVGGRAAQGVLRLVDHSAFEEVALVACVTAIAAGVATAVGSVVGAHVYRWPGWVAASAVVIPGLLVIAVTPIGQPGEIVLSLSLPVGAVVLAGWAGRHRFARRPRTLRAPTSR
jgi:hypothetical protein